MHRVKLTKRFRGDFESSISQIKNGFFKHTQHFRVAEKNNPLVIISPPIKSYKLLIVSGISKPLVAGQTSKTPSRCLRDRCGVRTKFCLSSIVCYGLRGGCDCDS